MRKEFILFIIALLLPWNTNAQKQEGHLKFKGVEIKNSYDYLKKALCEKGFSENENQTLVGQFAGYETEATILVSEQGTPYAVRAKLPVRNEWKEVEEDYNLFKKNITKKYGEPFGRQEEFLDPYKKGDGFEDKALALNKANYYCLWSLPNGTIEIKINAKFIAGMLRCDMFLTVTYTDKTGLETTESMKAKQFIEDL